MRAISTVLDVAVFLLLLSASVGTLAMIPDFQTGPVTVDDTATVLGTTTAKIEHGVRGSERRAHGTLAVLLGRAAVANSSIEGESLAPSRSDFGGQVCSTTRARIADPNRTNIAVSWEPYGGAPLRGSVTVGPAPPPAADVTVATLTVPSPAETHQEDALRVVDGGYQAVATVVANAVAETLLPGSRLEASASRQSPTAVVSSTRFRAFSAGLGLSVDSLLAEGKISTARNRVSQALADRFAADMRERFATPERAASAVRVGTIDVVIRRWTV
jgi:hypothetical protein